jgi:sugar O-acyltransferase (sialic acid O-acetyltransferase NeuD family)
MKIVLFGTGQVAELAHFYLSHDSPHDVVGFTVDEAHLDASSMMGLPVVPFENLEHRFPPDEHSMLVSIGRARMNLLRQSRYRAAKDRGYRCISYVSSQATISPDVRVGENSLILENTVVQPFATLGDDVVIWSGCHVGHHSAVGDHCFLSPHVTVSSEVRIGNRCFLGAGATISDGVSIAEECSIGAGSLIMRATHAREVYVGARAELLPLPSDRLPPARATRRVDPS